MSRNRKGGLAGGSLVLLDTNALFLPFSSPLRLEPEVWAAIGRGELAVPSSVLGEVARLEARGVTNATAALALARRLRVVTTRLRGDAGVLDAAHRSSAWVLTADRALQRRLRSAGVPVLVPRGRHGLLALGAAPSPNGYQRSPARFVRTSARARP